MAGVSVFTADYISGLAGSQNATGSVYTNAINPTVMHGQVMMVGPAVASILIDTNAKEFWVSQEDGVNVEANNINVGVGMTFTYITVLGGNTYATTTLGYPMRARGWYHFVKDTTLNQWHASRSA
jgi:hypothetical protein